MDKTIILSNSNKIDVDFFDLEFRTDYAEKAKKYSEQMQAIDPTGDDIDVLNKQYNCTEEFIDSVFGEGTLSRMLGGKKQLDLMLEFIVALTKHKEKMDEALNKSAIHPANMK